MVSWLLFFFNDTATTEIYTLSLHAALPIFPVGLCLTDGNGALIEANPALAKHLGAALQRLRGKPLSVYLTQDRKSTRLNSSHANISYAVFCLKKKTNALAPPPALQRPYAPA